MNGAPLADDVRALTGVLLDELQMVTRFTQLRDHMASSALRLMDQVNFALAGFERQEALLAADAQLCALRAQMRLAHELGLFLEDGYVDLIEQADTVGRQIGGLLKSLEHDAG